MKIYIRAKLNWDVTKLLGEMAKIRLDLGGAIDEEGQLAEIMTRYKIPPPGGFVRTVPPYQKGGVPGTVVTTLPPVTPDPIAKAMEQQINTFDTAAKTKWFMEKKGWTVEVFNQKIHDKIETFNGLIDDDGAMVILAQEEHLDLPWGDKKSPAPVVTPVKPAVVTPAKKTSAPVKKSESAKPPVSTVTVNTLTKEGALISKVTTVTPPPKDETKLVGKSPVPPSPPVPTKKDPRKELYGVQVTLISGIPGDGKSWLVLHHPEKDSTFYFDLEDRYKEILKWNPGLIRTDQYVNSKVYTPDGFAVDTVKTFDSILPEFKKRIAERKYTHFVVDGIGDIRRMAEDKYIVEKKVRAAYGQGPWGEINTMTKDVVFAMINFARVNNTKVTFTCWLTDDYDRVKKPDGEYESVKNGKKTFDVSIKDYILGQIDEVITLKRSGDKFWARRIKSPRGNTEWMEWTIA